MKWHTEQRTVSELVPFERNPRQMTEKQVADLTASLQRFDLAEIPAINTDNTILAGHQRLRIMSDLGRGDETIDVRVPDRQLDPDEAREYLVRSNKNTGEWDWDALANEFDIEELTDWGFDEIELGVAVRDNPEDEWDGMPEFENEAQKPWKEIKVRFLCEDDYIAFNKLVDSNLTPDTQSIWYPKRNQDQLNAGKVYTDES